MFSRSSSRSRNGQRSSRGRETIEPSALAAEAARGWDVLLGACQHVANDGAGKLQHLANLFAQHRWIVDAKRTNAVCLGDADDIRAVSSRCYDRRHIAGQNNSAAKAVLKHSRRC